MISPESIESRIQQRLEELGMNPWLVTFTYEDVLEQGTEGGTLCITFYITEDLQELLRRCQWECKCDRSGFTVIQNTRTVILSDMALLELWSAL